MLYSIVIPVYRSAQTLGELVRRLTTTLDPITKQYEIIMVEDCGGDNSWQVMNELYERYRSVKIIKLMKNYGQHNAIMSGLNESTGEFVITLDDDLQHPPEEIPKLINQIKNGFDIVYGVYSSKKHTLFRNIGSELIQMFYKKTFHVSNNLTSFRIMRKSLVNFIIGYKKNYTFIDGLIAWYTNNIGTVTVEHSNRTMGASGYKLSKLILLAFNMTTNFSIAPLRMCTLFGLIFSLLAFSVALFMIIKKLFYGIPVLGFASIIISIMFFSGVQLITLGIIGEYIGRIHLNINNNPQFAIREKKEHSNQNIS